MTPLEPIPVSSEVAEHDATVRLVQIGERAMEVCAVHIEEEHATPWLRRPLKRWLRRRDRSTAIAAVLYMLGDDYLPSLGDHEEPDQ